MHAQEMLAARPDARTRENDPLVAAVEALYDCAQACAACADACVAELDAKLAQCIRLTMDSADLCQAAGSVATRRTGSNATVVMGLLMLAEALARDCAAECETHAARHAHCRVCAEVCRRTEAACGEARLAVAREQMQ